MNDDELKYELASKYADDFRTASRDDAYGSFIDGWDAACKELNDVRAGEVAQLSDSLQMACDERDQLRDQLQWSLQNEQQYKDELKASLERENQLRAEVERLSAENKHLRTNVLNPLTVNDMDENICLKAQCEKLAQALDDILMAVPSLSEVLKIARENLAEYREKFKK